jgi:hypothetical protein
VTGLTIQDPGLKGPNLLESISDAASGADRGGGIFAFATRGGIDALLGAKEVADVIEKHAFHLVVGVDSITDTRSLKVLEGWMGKREHLTAEVFVHDLQQIFHPKICWFGHGNRVTAIVGSGNLTLWGLTANFEAFATLSLEGESATAFEDQISGWLGERAPQLLPPDHPDAIERAKRNSGSERSHRRKAPPESEELDQSPPPESDAAALLFQLGRKKAAGRTLLDITKKHFQDYFHGEVGKHTYVEIRQIGADGQLGPPEPPRPVYVVPSGNYRLESESKRDRATEIDKGIPIAVFVRMPSGVFRYRLLWPDDDGFAAVDAFLADNHEPLPRIDSLRRNVVSLAELAAAWPDLPFLATPDGIA